MAQRNAALAADALVRGWLDVQVPVVCAAVDSVEHNRLAGAAVAVGDLRHRATVSGIEIGDDVFTDPVTNAELEI